MSNEAMNYVRQLKLEIPARKLILYSLADRADEEFACHPGIPLIAAECEVLPRQVKRHLTWFRQNGYLSDRERYRANGSQSSNRYYLHGPWDNYGGRGVPFPQIALPGKTNADEHPFRVGTRAAGGVSSTTPPGVSPTTSPRCPPGHGEGVAEDIGGMASRTPLGVSSVTRESGSSRTPPEPPVGTPSRNPQTNPGPPPSVVKGTVPGARGPGREEDGLAPLSEEMKVRAVGLLTALRVPGKLLSPEDAWDLAPRVARCLSEPGPWPEHELLVELQRDHASTRNLKKVLHQRLWSQIDPLYVTAPSLAWSHEIEHQDQAEELPARPDDVSVAERLAQLDAATGRHPGAGAASKGRALITAALKGEVVDDVGGVLVQVDDVGQLPGQLGVALPEYSQPKGA